MRRASYVVGVVAALGVAALAVAQTGGGEAQGGGRLGRDQEKLDLPLDRWQAKRLPALPQGVTTAMIVAGDSLYRGKGGCVTCHGPDAFGMANAGSGLTMGLNFIPGGITDIDSLITAGIPESLTRSSVAMPPRGLGGNLTPEETHHLAAYVWAISRVHAEPWPGGHRTHKAGAAGDTARAAGSE